LQLEATNPQGHAFLRLTAAANDPAVTQLGFAPDQESAGPLALNVQMESMQDRVAIGSVLTEGSAVLLADGLNASARHGIVDVAIQGGTASGALCLLVAQQGGGLLPLWQQLRAAHAADGPFQAHPNGGITLNFPLSVAGQVVPLGSNPLLQVEVTDLFEDPVVHVRSQDMATLDHLQHFDIPDLIQGLRQTVQAIRAMMEDTAANEPLPFSQTSAAGLAPLVAPFESAIRTLQAQPPTSLQTLEAAVESAFGVASDKFSWALVGDNDLRLQLEFAPAGFHGSVPLHLDLPAISEAAGGIANLQGVPELSEVGSATLAVQSAATALLTFGFDLSPDAGPVPYLRDSSTVTLATSGQASNASWTGMLGPMFVDIGGSNITWNDGSGGPLVRTVGFPAPTE
jgi:hypothetical protein